MKKLAAIMLVLLMVSAVVCSAEDYDRYLKTYFSDPTCDYVFEIPDYWHLTEAGDYEESFMALFETNKDDGSEIYYYSLDMYSHLVDILGSEVYTREEINASMFPLSLFAQYTGIPESDLSVITKNGKDFFKAAMVIPADDYDSSEVYNLEIYLLIENGFILGLGLSTLPNVDDVDLSWYRSELETMYTSLHYQERSTYDKLLAMIYDEYNG